MADKYQRDKENLSIVMKWSGNAEGAFIQDIEDNDEASLRGCYDFS